MRMGKFSRASWAMFLVWLFVLTVPVRAESSSCTFSVSEVAAQSTKVSVDPLLLNVPVGDSGVISLGMTDVVDLATWQVALKYNATVLNLTALWIPGDNVFDNLSQVSPDPVFGKDAVDGLDYVLYGDSLMFGAVNASAGVLFRANFTGLSVGETPIAIATKWGPVHFTNNSWDVFYSFLLDSSMEEMAFVEENGDATVGVATFLTLTSTSGGTTSPVPNTYMFLNKSEVSVTALPDPGYDLNGWELDGVNMSAVNPLNVTMDVNHTLRAVFLPHISVTWTVSQAGPADFHSIQEAIDSPLVTYGDVILVKRGIYYENVYMSKKLTLTGENKDTTIIDGNGTGTVIIFDGNVSGFTIRNGEYGVGIRNPWSSHAQDTSYFGSSGWIEGNRIVKNRVGGVTIGVGTGPPVYTNTTVSNNYIANNTLYGIHIWNAINNEVVGNTVEDNEYGIDFYGGSCNNTLRNNMMLGNKYNFGIILRGDTTQFFYSSPMNFLNNDVDGSNMVDGKPIYYWVGRHDAQVPSDAGCVILYNCKNVSVERCNLSNSIEGILVMASNYTILSDNKVTDNVYGIYLALRSSNNSIIGNTLVNNINGVYLGDFSRYTTMRNNSINGGLMNFGMAPWFYLTWDYSSERTNDMDKTILANDIDSSNTVDGKPMIYWFNQHDRQVPANAGFVMLINCTGITVKDLNLTNNIENIVIFASNDTLIRNNYVATSVYGIEARPFYRWRDDQSQDVRRSFNVTVCNNTFVNNGVGVHLFQADNSTVSGNAFEGNSLGILFSDTNYGTISGNIINGSDVNPPHSDPYLYIFYYPAQPADHFAWEWSKEILQLEVGGVYVGGGHNTVYGNSIMNSAYCVVLRDLVRSYYGSFNRVFHNNFINITAGLKAMDGEGGNEWDSGYPEGGNYWSNGNHTDLYSGSLQNLNGSDGICDIKSSPILGWRPSNLNYDNYPLVFPVNFYYAATWNGKDYSIDVQSNSTVTGFRFNGPLCASVTFEVSGPSGTTGFCRMTIPKTVLWANGGQWTVLVGGTPVSCQSVIEDADFTYLYFNYTHSAKTVEIMGTGVVSEFPSGIILPMFLVATLAMLFLAKKVKCGSRV